MTNTHSYEGADRQLVELIEHCAGTDDWRWIDKDQQNRVAQLLRRLFEDRIRSATLGSKT